MSDFVYNGFWFSPEASYTRKCLEISQDTVTGTVTVQLFKGNGKKVFLLFLILLIYKKCKCDLRCNASHSIHFISSILKLNKRQRSLYTQFKKPLNKTFLIYMSLVFGLARTSSNSLYNMDLVSMDIAGGFSPEDSTGFININALRLKEYARFTAQTKL